MRALALLVLIACGEAEAQSTAAKFLPRGCRDRSCMAARCGRAGCGASQTGYALDGHSILAGFNSTFSLPGVVQNATGVNTPTTFAIAGSRTSQCVSRAASGILGQRFSVLDWQCGVNDIAFDLAGPLATEQAAEVSWNAAVARGMYVIVNSELPCGDAGASIGGACWGTAPDRLTEYNAYANFWALTHGTAARYLDGTTTLSDGGIALDPRYASTDFLHLNDAGAGLWAQLIVNAIDAGPQGSESGGVVVQLGSAGLGATCACANITTDDGGTITYTRTNAAFCAKGGSWLNSGIASGDLVSCAANKPRVEPGYDGGASLLMEPSVVNHVTQPTDVGHGADWVTQQVGAAVVPVVTTGQADPLGGTAGVRIDFKVTSSSSDGSLIYNPHGCTTGGTPPQIASMYARGVVGVSDTGTFGYCVSDGSFTTNHCFTCAYTSASFTRCHSTSFTESDAEGYLLIGNVNFYNGSGTAQPAQSVILWGADCEASYNLTSYVTGTRSTETATVSVALVSGAFSGAGTWDTPAVLVAGQSLFQARKDASNYVRLFTVPAAARADYVVGGVSSVISSAVSHDLVAGASNHMWTAYGVGTRAMFTDFFNATNGVLTLGSGASTVYIGGTATAGQEATGWVRDFKVCTSAGVCR